MRFINFVLCLSSETAIPPHSCLQCRLLPITSTLQVFKKISRYSAELARKMADHLIALYDFHSVFVHGVFKLSLSNKFCSH